MLGLYYQWMIDNSRTRNQKMGNSVEMMMCRDEVVIGRKEGTDEWYRDDCQAVVSDGHPDIMQGDFGVTPTVAQSVCLDKWAGIKGEDTE